MQAQSFFIGGIPVIFYGDEQGYTNDYSYLSDPGKSYDNRWIHRPVIDWDKWEAGENADGKRIFAATQHLIQIRKKLPAITDAGNLSWLTPHNIHVAGFIRENADQQVYCLFNFSQRSAYLTWYAFKEKGKPITRLYDHWTEQTITVGFDHDYFILKPYGFHILEVTG